MPNTKKKKKVTTNKNDENHIAKMERMAEIAVVCSFTSFVDFDIN